MEAPSKQRQTPHERIIAQRDNELLQQKNRREKVEVRLEKAERRLELLEIELAAERANTSALIGLLERVEQERDAAVAEKSIIETTLAEQEIFVPGLTSEDLVSFLSKADLEEEVPEAP